MSCFRQVKHSWLIGLMAVSAFSAASNLDSALDKGVQRANTAQKAQAKIDAVDDKARTLEQEYFSVAKEIDGLKVYLSQLDQQISAQDKELKEIENSIEEVTLIERQITPLMLKMIDALDAFVNADVPFQKSKRLDRVAKLKQLMARADVTVAEKYRKVLDAYQKEMDFGRTIKSYRDSLAIDGQEKEVDFLRVGRVALMYQTLDGEQIGIWNKETKAFEALDAKYKSKLTQALRVAREQAAPALIKVPVNAAVAATEAK